MPNPWIYVRIGKIVGLLQPDVYELFLAEYIREETIIKADWDLTYGRDIIPEKSWFKEIPQIISQETSDVVSEIDKSVWDSLPPNHYMHLALVN